MSAQAVKKKPIGKITTKTTAKQQHIIDVKSSNPALTVRQIAKICDTGHSHVVQTLQRYHIQQAEVEAFKANRADILAGLQHRLLASVTDEDIQKAPLGSRILASAQLYDKERIERGLSTADQPIMVIIRNNVQVEGSSTTAQKDGKLVDITPDNNCSTT